MQTRKVIAATLLLGVTVLSVHPGYYKRPLGGPPAKLYHGHKPPISHYYKTPAYHGPPRRPGPPRNTIRAPPRPYFNKPTPPPPPPFPPASWKSPSFSAPVVKETFHSAPLSSYTPDFLDEDKGPIHTIPAPNLSLADRPTHGYTAGTERPTQGYTAGTERPALGYTQASTPSNYETVFRHGQTVQPPTLLQYQVTEDPSAYKPYSGSPSYFAPDPDPSLPTVEVPKTFDPHSLPSNGVVPLDVYQQQQEDQAQQSYADASGNTLSPQDLYNLLNGYSQQQQQPMTAALYQQYLQAALGQQQTAAAYQQTALQTFNQAAVGQHQQTAHQNDLPAFNQAALFPQHYQQQVAQFTSQNFHPQFENFNYNEQTQESAHGSDSFPSASSFGIGLKRAVSKDTGFSGESINGIPSDFKDHKTYLEKGKIEDSSEVGVLSNQVDYVDEESTEESDRGNIINTEYYATLPNQKTAETLATLAVAGSINNQMMKSPVVNTEKGSQENSKEDTRQSSVKMEMNSQRNDEKRQENNNGHFKQPYLIQELRAQEQNEGKLNSYNVQPQEVRVQYTTEAQRQQPYSINEEKTNPSIQKQPFRNHNMGEQVSIQPNLNQQSYRNYDMRGQQQRPADRTPQNMNSENRGHNLRESDYSEEEILDPSDKDQRSFQSGMRMYQNTMNTYYRNKNDQEESPVEEQTYEYTDNDYSQEEEKEIRKQNEVTKSPTNMNKGATYNAQQNQLPYGAKLRPKRN